MPGDIIEGSGATEPTADVTVDNATTPSVATTGGAAGNSANAAAQNHQHPLNLTGDVTSVGVATTLAAGSASNLNSGTLPAARLPALTGDVTSSVGSAATTLGTKFGPNASWNGLLGWTSDVELNGGTVTPTAATIYLQKLVVPSALTITNIIVVVSTAGTNYSNAQVGLYTSDGTTLTYVAASAVLATGGTDTFVSTGSKTIPLGVAQPITAGTIIYLGLHLGTNSSTAAVFRAPIASSGAILNAGTTSQTLRSGSYTGHATNPLATIGNLTANSMPSAQAPWFGFS